MALLSPFLKLWEQQWKPTYNQEVPWLRIIAAFRKKQIPCFHPNNHRSHHQIDLVSSLSFLKMQLFPGPEVPRDTSRKTEWDCCVKTDKSSTKFSHCPHPTPSPAANSQVSFLALGLSPKHKWLRKASNSYCPFSRFLDPQCVFPCSSHPRTVDDSQNIVQRKEV